MQKGNKKRTGLASAASLFSSYRSKAKSRGLEFNLNFEQFLELTGGDCYLCGRPPGQTVKARHRNGEYIYNGIDRVENSKGYSIFNCKACCKTCNQMKASLSLMELTEHLRKILNRLIW